MVHYRPLSQIKGSQNVSTPRPGHCPSIGFVTVCVYRHGPAECTTNSDWACEDILM